MERANKRFKKGKESLEADLKKAKMINTTVKQEQEAKGKKVFLDVVAMFEKEQVEKSHRDIEEEALHEPQELGKAPIQEVVVQ